MKKMNWKKFLALTASAALALALLAGCGAQPAEQASAENGTVGTVLLSVNPEIEVEYDKNGMVLEIEGLNKDGKTVVKDVKDYQGKDCRTVVNELVREISDTSAKRYEGCVEAFRKNGLTFDDETMYYTGRYSYEFGYNGMKQALRERKKLTAVFAMADVIAIGAIRALFDEGLRVPEDISVVGYDGLRIGDFYVPKLTTISQSVELLAKCSFELLISCMQGAPAQHLTVPFRLLRRQSVRQITE